MKKIILILLTSSLLASCGTEPRDPVRQSAAVIGREADRREKEQKKREEFFERMQYQKKRDNFDKAARNFSRPIDIRVPERSPAPRQNFRPFGN